jgi:hypothetical protein
MYFLETKWVDIRYHTIIRPRNQGRVSRSEIVADGFFTVRIDLNILFSLDLNQARHCRSHSLHFAVPDRAKVDRVRIGLCNCRLSSVILINPELCRLTGRMQRMVERSCSHIVYQCNVMFSVSNSEHFSL